MARFVELHIREYAEPKGLRYRGRFVHNWFSNFDKVGHPVTYGGFRTAILETHLLASKTPAARVPAADGLGEFPFIERVFSVTSAAAAKKLGAPRSRGGII